MKGESIDRIFLLVLFWLFVTTATTVAEDGTEEGEVEEDSKPVKCGVYLAKSTIPGSGLGMFAGDKSYKGGDVVTLGDTVIPIMEYEWNNENKPPHEFLWDEYTWNCEVFPGAEEEGDDTDLINFASPGVGAAANSYISLANLEDAWIKLGSGMKGDSPGVGASSIYYGREFYATDDIPMGAELFVDYGSNYFQSRPSVYGYIPLPAHYPFADRIIEKFVSLAERLNFGSESSSKVGEDLWKLMTGQASVWGKSRVLNALPRDYSLVEPVRQNGGTARQDYNRSIREVSWLEEHGRCMDNIKVGQSENPDAGRGAFANRFIPKGGLVAPAPLIHIGDRETLRIYQATIHKRTGAETPNMEGPHTYQLIMNYCFGHSESSLLLCPYGLLTAYINHSHDKPNTRIQWSKEMRHPSWKDQKISRWAKEYHTGLSFDFVALRDIEEDEEILIDYGDAWEFAWRRHVQTFVPREGYVPAYELNKMENLTYRTLETDDRPYEADGVTLMCRGFYVRRYANTKDDIGCRIIKQMDDDEDSYIVQIASIHVDNENDVTRLDIGPTILWDIPSDAFFFKDLSYSRDQHRFDAFRHSMSIPDDIFPDIWRNKRNHNTKQKITMRKK